MPTYITPDSGRLIVKSIKDLDLNNILSDDAALLIQGGQYIEGNLYVGGTLVVNGDVVTLGNAGGSLTFNANVSSDILPSTTETYNIGSNLEKWNSVFTKNLQSEKFQISSNPAVVSAIVDITTSVNHVNATTPVAVSLADGNEGQILSIVVVETPPLAVVLTPANPLGFSSIIMTNSGDSVTMMFTNGSWAIVSLFRSSVI